MSKPTMKDRIEQASDLRHADRAKENAIADHDRGDITGAQKAKVVDAADKVLDRQDKWDK